MMTADAVWVTTTDLLQGRLRLDLLSAAVAIGVEAENLGSGHYLPHCAAHVDRRFGTPCTLELTSPAGAQEVSHVLFARQRTPRSQRRSRLFPQPVRKIRTDSAIYWAGSGPKVHVIRQVR